MTFWPQILHQLILQPILFPLQRLDHLHRDDEPGWRWQDLRRSPDAARRSRIRSRCPRRLLHARQGMAPSTKSSWGPIAKDFKIKTFVKNTMPYKVPA